MYDIDGVLPPPFQTEGVILRRQGERAYVWNKINLQLTDGETLDDTLVFLAWFVLVML